MTSVSTSSVESFDGASDTDVAWILSSPPPTGQTSEYLKRVSTPGLNEPAKHPRFYYKDGSLTFWMNDVVFRVHGSIFASLSPIWAKRLESVETMDIVGRDIGVSASELSSFLSILYPRGFYTPELNSVTEWISTLRLASIWAFDGIRELAIRELDGRLPPLQRLVLSRAYDIPSWLPDAFVNLILREASLSMAEMKMLESNIQDIAHITSGREAVLCRKVSANARSVRAHVLKHIVQIPAQSEKESLPAPTKSSVTEPAQTSVEAAPAAAETTMTPQTLPSARPDDTNTQFTFEESQALKTALSNYDYDTAIQYARVETLPVFCEAIALSVDDLDWLSNYEKLTFAIVRLVVLDASSHQRSLRLLEFLAVISEPKKGLFRKYKALLKAIVEELRDTWRHIDVCGYITDESVRRLASFDGHAKAFKVLGPRDFLVAFPSVCIQRSLNLKPFIAALGEETFVE
ncbi:unnamed protein product [Peniophora sp. CBMAI 1063]|nr:unnamed protein product [Peniophora sp. CBMAI 1063]